MTRNPQTREASKGEAAREFIVTVDLEKNRFRGSLLFRGPDGERRGRRVTSATCADLIEALGFVVALSIENTATSNELVATAIANDATSASDPTDAADVASPSEASSPNMNAPPAKKVAAASIPDRDVDSALAADTADTAEKPKPSRESVREPPWWVKAGTSVGVVGGTSSRLLLANRVFVGASYPIFADNPIWVPSFTIAGTMSTTDLESNSYGNVALRWRAFVGTLCPLVLPLTTNLSVRPCGVLELGDLRADGVAIANARRQEAGWTAVGGTLLLEYRFTKHLMAEMDLGASGPTVRPRFRYTSSNVAFDTPQSGVRAGLGLAVSY